MHKGWGGSSHPEAFSIFMNILAFNVCMNMRASSISRIQRHPTRMWGALVEIFCRFLAIIFDFRIVSFRFEGNNNVSLYEQNNGVQLAWLAPRSVRTYVRLGFTDWW